MIQSTSVIVSKAVATLSTSLVKLAEAYEHLLFEGELRGRFSHHVAHVASERWLAVLVNERAAEFGLPGWTAVAENGFVDVALIPPGTNPRLERLPDNAIRIELKRFFRFKVRGLGFLTVLS